MHNTKFCQSCSMPIDEIEFRGTEKNGSRSEDYCKYCYKDGAFTHPYLTLEEMVNNMSKRMDKEQLPAEIVEAAIARLPDLKRWKIKA